jgi:ABC-2 type transport system ATP-binding protein
MINISNVSKTYATGFSALTNINLEVRQGEIFALLGPNGKDLASRDLDRYV